MRRCSLLILTLAVCAVGLCGCGPSAFTNLRKPGFKPDVAKADRAPEKAPRKRSERGPSTAEPANDEAAPPEDLAARPKGDAAGSETGNLANFEPELLELIEEELAQTPPEERAQFYRDIVSLQPAMVRQIIQTRRIVRQVGQDAPSRFVTPDQMLGRNPGRVRQAAGEQFADDGSQNQIGRNPARDPGLGAVDPWNRQTPSPENSAGGWNNESAKPPAPLPFNQIPALSGTGHSSKYNTSQNPVQMDTQDFVSRNLPNRPRIQPPPGGSSTPTNQQGVSVVPNAPRQHLNARVPYDYNPLAPPVPDYNRNSDPFGGGTPAVRTASQNPNQKLPGVANTMGLGESFGPPNVQNPPAPNAPANRGAAWETDLNRLIASQEADVASLRFAELVDPAQQNAYIQKHVYLRMLYLMAGQEARAVAAIPEIPASDQEFWQQTFWAMSNYFDTNSMPDSDYRATQTIAQLRTAIQKLQENARLELRNVAFCHKISSFGNFDRFPQDEFGPGQPVLVYAEVTNFKSEPTTLPNKPNQTAYRTQLKSSIEIHRLGPTGELVERFDFEPTEDLCHNHRRDYFHSYEFTIPQRISLGPHVMTLTVEDQLSGKVASYRLNFMVK